MNTIYDHYRKNYRKKEDSSLGGHDFVKSEKNEFENLENRELVKFLLEKLPFKLKEVVILFYIFDFKISEISESLKIREGTVKSRLYNAKEQLNLLIQKMEIDHERI